MTVHVKRPNGDVYSFTFPVANDVNAIVRAMAENIPDFATIEIIIHSIGDKLCGGE